MFPQASVAVQVLVLDLSQNCPTSGPVTTVIVAEPQLSVALAVPNAAKTWASVGLHPKVADGVTVITGAVWSKL